MSSNFVTAAATFTLISVGLYAYLVLLVIPLWLSITALFLMFLGLRFYSVRIIPFILFFVAAIFNIASGAVALTDKLFQSVFQSVLYQGFSFKNAMVAAAVLQFLSAALLFATFVEKRGKPKLSSNQEA